jgi:hypothetical protein
MMQSYRTELSVGLGILTAAATCFITYKYLTGEKDKYVRVVGAGGQKRSLDEIA